MDDAASTTLLVIGGGPGGYVAAIRAGQLGIATVLVEGERARRHLPEHRLHPVQGADPRRRRVREGPALRQRLAAGHPASQSPRDRPRADRALEGRHRRPADRRRRRAAEARTACRSSRAGPRIVDGKTVDVTPAPGERDAHRSASTCCWPPARCRWRCRSCRSAAASFRRPRRWRRATLPQRLVVVGAGYIGLELGIAYRKLGAEVTVVEAHDRVLPAYDEELTGRCWRRCDGWASQLHLGCTVQGLNPAGDAVRVRSAQGRGIRAAADQVLVAVGRRPRTEGLGLESLHAGHGRAARVRIDDQCRTSMRNVWAIGDVDRRADAGAPRDGAGRDGGRDHRRPAAPIRAGGDSRRVLHRPGDRGRRPVAGAKRQQAGLDCISAAFPFAANGRAMTHRSRAKASSASSPAATTT